MSLLLKLSVIICTMTLTVVCLSSIVAAGSPTLKFHADGTFKIIQFTDIHMEPDKGADYLKQYSDYIGLILDSEQPDLVVFTGDYIWTKMSLSDHFDNTLNPVISRKIPWAVVLGNHDFESRFTGPELMNYLQNRPYSLVKPGPDELGGSGNYTLEIKAAQTSKIASLIYLLDSRSQPLTYIDYKSRNIERQVSNSHAAPNYKLLVKKFGADADEIFYAIKEFDKKQIADALTTSADVKLKSGKIVKITKDDFQPLDNGEYDRLSPEQINWYRSQSTNYTKNNNNAPLPALMFFHIPLMEYSQLWQSGKVSGTKLETECSPKRNTGMFAALLEKHDVMGVFVGHDHVNDYVGFLQGVALGYGRKSGIGCYGPAPLERGGRVFVLHEGKRSFDTWIRTETGRQDNSITIPTFFE
ncbi:MAG: metallophosphoesterase family protein [Bacillota bacterium]